MVSKFTNYHFFEVLPQLFLILESILAALTSIFLHVVFHEMMDPPVVYKQPLVSHFHPTQVTNYSFVN